MTRRAILCILALALCPLAWSSGQVDDRAVVDRSQTSRTAPLRKGVFQAHLLEENLAEPGKQPSLARLVATMSRENRNVAKGQLAELEGRTSESADLREIAQAYLLLKSPADEGWSTPMRRINGKISRRRARNRLGI